MGNDSSQNPLQFETARNYFAIHACDIKPSKQAEVAKFADSFTDWQTLVNEQELDIVAIVTPADTHCDLALQILDYCKSIFIEKPIGLSQYEASSIIAKVQELGGQLLVGHFTFPRGDESSHGFDL